MASLHSNQIAHGQSSALSTILLTIFITLTVTVGVGYVCLGVFSFKYQDITKRASSLAYSTLDCIFGFRSSISSNNNASVQKSTPVVDVPVTENAAQVVDVDTDVLQPQKNRGSDDTEHKKNTKSKKRRKRKDHGKNNDMVLHTGVGMNLLGHSRSSSIDVDEDHLWTTVNKKKRAADSSKASKPLSHLLAASTTESSVLFKSDEQQNPLAPSTSLGHKATGVSTGTHATESQTSSFLMNRDERTRDDSGSTLVDSPPSLSNGVIAPETMNKEAKSHFVAAVTPPSSASAAARNRNRMMLPPQTPTHARNTQGIASAPASTGQPSQWLDKPPTFEPTKLSPSLSISSLDTLVQGSDTSPSGSPGEIARPTTHTIKQPQPVYTTAPYNLPKTSGTVDKTGWMHHKPSAKSVSTQRQDTQSATQRKMLSPFPAPATPRDPQDFQTYRDRAVPSRPASAAPALTLGRSKTPDPTSTFSRDTNYFQHAQRPQYVTAADFDKSMRLLYAKLEGFEGRENELKKSFDDLASKVRLHDILPHSQVQSSLTSQPLKSPESRWSKKKPGFSLTKTPILKY